MEKEEWEFYQQACADEADFKNGKYISAEEMSQILAKYIIEDSSKLREEIRKKYS